MFYIDAVLRMKRKIEMKSGHGETSWCFSQIKGALDDDVTDADIISCVEFNHDGELLATGDKGGRVVIFQVRKSFMQFNSMTIDAIF